MEPVFFHFSKILPPVNQVAVPPWWALQAILWFDQGSGTDNQRRNLCCNLSPEKHLQIKRSIKATKVIYERSFLLIFIAASCMRTTGQSKEWYLGQKISETYPKLVWFRPSIPHHLTALALSPIAFTHTNEKRPPSITTSILLTKLWTTLRVWAAVVRDSSTVSRSSLSRTASMSLSPSNFFANLSVANWIEPQVIYDKDIFLLNRPWLICLVARARTDRISVMILTKTSVITGVGGISA